MITNMPSSPKSHLDVVKFTENSLKTPDLPNQKRKIVERMGIDDVKLTDVTFIDAERESTAVSRFLTGKKLYLTGLESEKKEIELVNRIGKAGGEVVSNEHNGPIDYLVTGLIYDVNKQISMEPTNIWTHLWLEDCLDQGKIAPLKYFHQPIIPPHSELKF